VFYSIEAFFIVITALDTSDYGDRLAGFQMILIINAMKTQKL
jgi:hypothetical protein